MDIINNLAMGLGVALSLQNVLYALTGAILGTLVGVLPGLGPVATIASMNGTASSRAGLRVSS